MPALPSETTIFQTVQEVSASNDGRNSVLTTILVVVTILLVTGGGVLRWLYPNTIEDVEAQIRTVNELIECNMALERNVLGDSAWLFRERLIRCVWVVVIRKPMKGLKIFEFWCRENGVAARIRNRMNIEPDRKKILAWVAFHWRQMRDVKSSFFAVMELKESLTVRSDVLENGKGNDHAAYTPTLVIYSRWSPYETPRRPTGLSFSPDIAVLFSFDTEFELLESSVLLERLLI